MTNVSFSDVDLGSLIPAPFPLFFCQAFAKQKNELYSARATYSLFQSNFQNLKSNFNLFAFFIHLLKINFPNGFKQDLVSLHHHCNCGCIS